MHPQSLPRRRFLGTVAAVAAAGSVPVLNLSRAFGAAPIRETEHFWFRLAPEGPYIDSQRDNRAFGFGGGKVLLSEDCGQSWAHSAEFADA
jgi:hypothetical protein